MKAPHKYVQWAIVSALFGVGFTALLVLAGEDDSANPMPTGEWYLIKAAAVAVVYACYRLGRFLHNLGLLPEFNKEADL